MTMGEILRLIAAERARQDAIWGPNRKLHRYAWVTILTEEMGEVAKAALESDPQVLIVEMLHVAAVAIAYLETVESGLQKETK